MKAAFGCYVKCKFQSVQCQGWSGQLNVLNLNSTERFLILNKVRVEINFGIRQTEVTAKQESFAGANFMGFSCLILAEFDRR